MTSDLCLINAQGPVPFLIKVDGAVPGCGSASVLLSYASAVLLPPGAHWFNLKPASVGQEYMQQGGINLLH